MATKQHTYGSGELSFAPFITSDGQVPSAFRYLGNTPEFSLNSEVESLDHMDSDHGIKQKDDSVITSVDQSGAIVTDNLAKENLAIFFLGTSSSLSVSSSTATIENITAIAFGTYQLGATAANPTGVRNISAVVVTNGLAGLSLVTYVAGTDYVIDAADGTITFIEGGTIASGGPAKITYDNAATTREQIISGNTMAEGALRFKSFNATGPQRNYFMPWVKLTPNGEFNLKGDDWLTLPLNVEVLKKGSLASVYADGVATTS